jgi:hypothetical protein
MNFQNICTWSMGNPHTAHESPLRPVEIGAWCAGSCHWIAGQIFFKKNIWESYIEASPWIPWTPIWEKTAETWSQLYAVKACSTSYYVSVVRRANHFEWTAAPTLARYHHQIVFSGVTLKRMLAALSHTIGVNLKPAYPISLQTFYPWICRRYLWRWFLVIGYVGKMLVHIFRTFDNKMYGKHLFE